MSPRITAIALFALAAAGCSFMNVRTEVTRIAQDYKGKRTEPAKIEVFENRAPESPYTEIANIRVTGRRDVDQGELVEAMRIRAARLGADAIADVKFGEVQKEGGAGGEMVCPFEMPCTYQETESTIVGMPMAESTAIVFDSR